MEERPILDVAQVVELERRIAEAGTPLSELMERAGAAVAEAAKRLVGEAIAQKLKPLVILCIGKVLFVGIRTMGQGIF